jgi:hypothetical protein
VAGGGILVSEGTLHDVTWCTGNCSFISDLKILSLTNFDLIIGMAWLEQYSPNFDLIIGMAWLEQYSPMQVHWKSNWLQFQYHGALVRLQGLQADCQEPILLEICCASTQSELPDLSNLLVEL